MNTFAGQFHARYRDMLVSLLAEGEKVSPRGQDTLELRDVVYECPPDGDDCKAWGRTNDRYVLAEMAWYLSRDPSVAFIKQHAALWGRIQNPDGTANSNYGEKLWLPMMQQPPWYDGACISEWEWARRQLLGDPSTRQAVMVIHRPAQHWFGNKDVPCTLTVSFMLRDGHLELRAHMRSSDAWFGLPYDAPFFRWLQNRMVHELRVAGVAVNVGKMRIMLDSFHVYEHRTAHAQAYLDKWRPAPSWLNPVPVEGALDHLRQLAEDLLAFVPKEVQA